MNKKEEPNEVKNTSQKQENNFYDKATFYINTVLVIATVFMTYITYTSNGISKASVDTADKALKEAKRSNDLAEKNYSISSNSLAISDSINRENLKLTRESVTKQIEALTESQKQFEKTNKPYLQLRDFKITTLEENKPLKFQYVLQNLGSYPARIIDTEVGYFVDFKDSSDNPYSRNLIRKHDTSENYIIKEAPFSQYFNTESPISVFHYENLKNKKSFVYFFGDIIYISEVNNKKRKCQFYIQIYPPPSQEYKVIYIKNIDLE